MAWYVGRVGQSFDGGNPYTSAYTLFNGVNIINYDYDWDGLAYICYYSTDDPANHPDIKVHFMNGQVNGYLSPDKTNEEMHEMCVNAPNSTWTLWAQKFTPYGHLRASLNTARPAMAPHWATSST